MAIKMRRGMAADLNKTQLVPGEFAFQLDQNRVTACFGDGSTRDMATVEEFSNIISDAQTALQGVSVATEAANTAASEATAVKDAAVLATSGANQAATAANSATVEVTQAIINCNTATESAGQAALEAQSAADAATAAVSSADQAAARANTAAETCEGIIVGTGFIPTAEKGQPNGVAILDSTGMVPSSQIPHSATFAADVSYTDTHSIGGTDLQTVVDLIADRVLNQLLSSDNIINNQAVTEPGFAADARQLNPTIPGSLASMLIGAEGGIYYREYHHRDYDTTDPADMLRHFYPDMPTGTVLARITAKSGTSLALIQRYSAAHGSYIIYGYGTLPMFEQLQSGAWKGTKTITIT